MSACHNFKILRQDSNEVAIIWAHFFNAGTNVDSLHSCFSHAVSPKRNVFWRGFTAFVAVSECTQLEFFHAIGLERISSRIQGWEAEPARTFLGHFVAVDDSYLFHFSLACRTGFEFGSH
jgi:hypothetical protein